MKKRHGELKDMKSDIFRSLYTKGVSLEKSEWDSISRELKRQELIQALIRKASTLGFMQHEKLMTIYGKLMVYKIYLN